MSDVVVEIINEVGVITLNRPDKFNCLSMSVHHAIDEAREQFENDAGVRVILICSTGKHFCTGADLEEVSGFRDDPEKLREFIRCGHGVLRRLETSPLPTVVAIQGLCLAGGLELMLACDVAFAANSAQLGDQHSHFGLIPGWGGSQRLPRIVGRRVALDLLYSARWLSVTDALNCGLINYSVADDALHDEALSYCINLAAKSSTGLSLMKKLTDKGLDLSLDTSLELEANEAPYALSSSDVTEGLSAFLEKRNPQFAPRKPLKNLK